MCSVNISTSISIKHISICSKDQASSKGNSHLTTLQVAQSASHYRRVRSPVSIETSANLTEAESRGKNSQNWYLRLASKRLLLFNMPKCCQLSRLFLLPRNLSCQKRSKKECKELLRERRESPILSFCLSNNLIRHTHHLWNCILSIGANKDSTSSAVLQVGI